MTSLTPLEAYAEVRRRWHAEDLQRVKDENCVLRFSLALARKSGVVVPVNYRNQPRPKREKVVEPIRGFRKQIFDCLNGHPVGTLEIASKLNSERRRVSAVLPSLVKSGYVVRTGPGQFIRRVAALASVVALLAGCSTPPAPKPRAVAPLAPVVTFAWDASPDASVTGYRLYYGSASRSYTNSLNVGPARTVSITNPPVTIYAAATAYDAAGTESDFSNEARASLLTASNRIVTLTVWSNSVLGGWVRDARFPAVTFTNPPGPSGFWKLQATETFF